jgi:diguanylate cyclase
LTGKFHVKLAARSLPLLLNRFANNMLIPKVLVVNDDPASLLAFSHVCTIVTAQSGEQALRHVLTDDFAVILLDVNMPRMDGFETAEAIHSHPRSAATPIIFTTAIYNDDVYRLKGYQNGAVDYLLTPVIPQILQTKVAVFVELAKKRLELQSKTDELQLLNHDLKLQHKDGLSRIDAILEGKAGERRRSDRRRVTRKTASASVPITEPAPTAARRGRRNTA